MKKYQFPEGADIRADIRKSYNYDGDLLEIYAGTTGAVVHKWHHYLPIYERYFAPFRHRRVRFLEIGVSRGGSLQMWRRWLGDEAILYGVDVNPACARFDGQAGMVRIGSQADPGFMAAVVAEMGGIDVVLDDGSHQMEHIEASLNVLFPLLSPGGVYMIEDLHTAYWPRYGGGYRAPANFFNSVRRMIDDMHGWYHPQPPRRPETAGHVTGLHVHDSIVVLDKGVVQRPTHSFAG